VIAAAAESNKPVVTCWMGEEQVREARELLSAGAGIPDVAHAGAGGGDVSHISSFFRNQQLLRQTPPSISLSGDLQPPSVDSGPPGHRNRSDGRATRC
jgi:acetyltransferase